MDLKKLSMKEKIGQKFMFGVNSNNIDVIINLIKQYHIGGVILYKKNYKNYEEMLSVIKRLKEANKSNKIPLFIAIDQEGGRVNRMPLEFENLKNIYDMSKKNGDLISSNANITGRMLFETGININFAPVLDVCDDDKSKVLYKRCFYGDVSRVSENGARYVNGMKKTGVISVVKHFPGHGISKMDSHFITPVVGDYNKVIDTHILPFERAIKEGVDALMVGHLVIRKLTNGMPASISSKFIKEYIRDRYKFDGLVITDEMNMLSRNILYTFNYLKKAFVAGSDIILIKIKDRGNGIIDKCIKLTLNNPEYEKMLDESVSRIIKIKNKYNVSDNVDYVGCNVNEINKEIVKLNKMCSDN